jgi:two-component system OmpR family response regulator
MIVEDEEHLAIGIRFNLEKEGYRVTAFREGAPALKAIEEEPESFDLVVLDLMLPGMSGYAICEAIRERGLHMPILILSARTLSEDRTRGFEAGADQYMMKPFELDEFLTRVRGLLASHSRRTTAKNGPELTQYAFGEADINFETFKVTVAGRSVRMTNKEMRLLQYFIANEGRVIPRHELLENVWDVPGRLNTRAPDQFLRRLRKMFETDPAEPKHFQTIRDAGYRFVAEPEEE